MQKLAAIWSVLILGTEGLSEVRSLLFCVMLVDCQTWKEQTWAIHLVQQLEVPPLACSSLQLMFNLKNTIELCSLQMPGLSPSINTGSLVHSGYAPNVDPTYTKGGLD